MTLRHDHKVFLLGLVINLIGIPAFAADPLSLDVMFSKLIANIQIPLISLISVTAGAIGIVYLSRGLLKLTKLSDGSGRQSLNGAISSMVIGSILLSLPTAIGMVATTLNLSPQAQAPVLTYDSNIGIDPDSQARINNVVAAVFAFVQILGLISFIRGCGILRSVSDGGNQQVSVMAGFTHIIAGAFAFNLVDFIRMLQTTLGVSILT